MKRVLIWTLVLIVLCGAVSALPNASNLISWHGFETFGATTPDYKGSNTATVNGASQNVSNGILGSSVSFDGTNDELTIASNSSYGYGEIAISFWFRPTNFASKQQALIRQWSATSLWDINFRPDQNDKLWVNLYDSAQFDEHIMTYGQWHHVLVTGKCSTDNLTIYVNGTQYLNTAPTMDCDSATETIYIGSAEFAGREFAGEIDEISIWNITLNSTSAQQFMTGGAGGKPLNYSDIIPAPVPPGNTVIDLTITDQWNSSTISAFTVNISWANGSITEHSTTNGTVTVDASEYITDTTINVTYHTMTDYFNAYVGNEAITANTTNTVTTNTYQAVLCLNASEKVSQAQVAGVTFIINATTQECYNITAGQHEVTATKAGWYNRSQNVTVSALSNSTQTILNMTYANLTIYAVDGTTNATLSNYDVYINSVTWPAWSGESASAVTNHSFFLVDGIYNVTIDVPGYAVTKSLANVTVSGHTNYTFTLYKSNSVTINIFDEITGDLITENITIRWTSNSTTWENTTSTGEFFIYNITPADYTLLFYGSNYSTRTYSINVGNDSTQFLDAYMISSEYSTIFTIKDKDSGDVLDGVSFTMYKLVNSSWTPVESKYSDITGKVQVYYDPIGNYRIYLANDNYDDLIFYLNPILFSTYDVFMEKADLLNYSVDYDDISIVYSPQTFNNGNVTPFTFLISSPDGLLTDYSITLIYPGGTASASGVNAIGEQLNVNVNITNATRWDRVTLHYNYTTTLSGTREFTQYLGINTNATASENTWMANKDRTFGLGLFERFLIVTLIIIFLVGISTMVGQPIPGMALGLFMFGFMTYIGFIPLWGILPSMLIGVLFLVWKSGG